MNTKLVSYATAALLAVVISCGMSQDCYSAEETFDKTYTLEAGTPVTVKNVNGDISVSAWDEDYVSVKAVKKTKKGRSELDKVEIRVTTGDELSIETKYLEKRAKVTVEYTIKVPDDIPLKNARTTNGSVRVTGVTGDTKLSTTNGKIMAGDIDGIVEGYSTNGDIVLENVRGIREGRTTNGSLRISLRDRVENDIEIRTTNGSVELGIPENTDVDLDLRTVNGRIGGGGFSMVIDEVGRNRLKGRVGDGGYMLNVRTTNGSITLRKL